MRRDLLPSNANHPDDTSQILTVLSRLAEAKYLQLELMATALIQSVCSEKVLTTIPREISHNLTVLSEKYFGVTPLVAGRGVAEWGIALDVEQPDTVGADRVLNVIAAHDTYKQDIG